mgnify:CR=1 FL=1
MSKGDRKIDRTGDREVIQEMSTEKRNKTGGHKNRQNRGQDR